MVSEKTCIQELLKENLQQISKIKSLYINIITCQYLYDKFKYHEDFEGRVGMLVLNSLKIFAWFERISQLYYRVI